MLNFLRKKLVACERAIVALPEWSERKVLKRMIAEMEDAKSSTYHVKNGVATLVNERPVKAKGDGKRVITIPDGVVASVRRARKGGYKKLYTNGPMNKTQHGRRIADFYDIVEKVVTENGGKIAIAVLEDYLQSMHNMPQMYGKNRLSTVMCSYINIYNKTNTGDVRVVLWPEKLLGEKRVGKYKEVRLSRELA